MMEEFKYGIVFLIFCLKRVVVYYIRQENMRILNEWDGGQNVKLLNEVKILVKLFVLKVNFYVDVEKLKFKIIKYQVYVFLDKV